MMINLPGSSNALIIVAVGAPSKRYVKGLTVNGRTVDEPVLRHEDIAHGGEIVFEMADVPQLWGSSTLG